ncbi:hypothetical protein [Kribbella pratensis]|uniref:Uncharacterized protein n=1 Tax=Kribbella pratensis TaxID=2512112 RepID=A0A4V3GF98_9ACTN|nr:hypothetical protein [Kribbella pratensis]TDW65989.1 hypothetical protein EV653_6004 [Kribbella pratensis]
MNEQNPVTTGRTATWAMEQLVQALAEKGITAADPPVRLATLDEVPAADLADVPESYAVLRVDDEIVVVSNDEIGLRCGVLELADRVAAGEDLAGTTPFAEQPAVPVRGVVRSFSSVDEDSPWFHDRRFWTEYLTWLAASRFNRFHLALGMQYNYGADRHGATDNYLCFVYPFLFDVDGYEVQAEGVGADEQKRNLDTLRFIAAESKRRGLKFQLGLWNHAYDYGRDSVHRYPITGIGPETHAEYCKAGIAKLLTECPDIDGLTFRVHYEGGIPDDKHEIFWRAVFEGANSVGRPLEVDMHAKGVDQALLDAVDLPNLSPVLSAKYWAEHVGLPYHQASIRAKETAKPIPPGHELKGITEFSRRFTRYGYGDFLREDRTVDLMFRVWPGTQKLLAWGDPAIAAGYGRLSTFGGSRGVDFCEPLFFKGRKGSGEPGKRDPYVREDLRLSDNREWTKYRYGYLLWGRLLYNPDAEPETWRRHLRATYGEAAAHVEDALSPLSRILPLVTVVHGVGGSNNGYWPEVYLNLPISSRVESPHYAADTDPPVNWGGVSPFDPTTFYAIDEYVAALASGSVSAKYTPLEVAAWIERLVDDGQQALDRARETADESDAQVRRVLIDLEILVRMGRFFAGKFRAAVDYSIYRTTKQVSALESAVEACQAARDAYAEIPGIVDGVYQPDLRFGIETSEHGHWEDRIPAIDADLAALEEELKEATGTQQVTQLAQAPARPATAGVDHKVPASFDRGKPVTLSLDVVEPDVIGATLHYRHVDQSKPWQQVPMELSGQTLSGTIDSEYTSSTYPLMYFFSVQHRTGGQALYPGLAADLSNQPYVVLGSSTVTG